MGYLGPIMDFGIRSVPPCEDCWENGHCSMNCGPTVKIEKGGENANKTGKQKKVPEGLACNIEADQDGAGRK